MRSAPQTQNNRSPVHNHLQPTSPSPIFGVEFTTLNRDGCWESNTYPTERNEEVAERDEARGGCNTTVEPQRTCRAYKLCEVKLPSLCRAVLLLHRLAAGFAVQCTFYTLAFSTTAIKPVPDFMMYEVAVVKRMQLT